ncbi:anti-sigma factor [Neorhizobium sp. NPDC001467]|uniref:anti-sigma factor n=1 Tax=Neorhizobium sp. NPDC001467 TaxID=3390595 RepID=UPI003D066D00
MTTPEQSEGDRARDQVIAGEYVLGVLSLEERRNVEARMARDTVFAAMVGRWSENLSSFDDDYDPATPRAGLYPRIEARLFPKTPKRGLAGAWSSVALWRAMTALSLLLLAGTVVVQNLPVGTRPQAQPLVAQLSGEGNAISLVASYSADSGRLSLTPVAAGPSDQRSLELWMISGNDPAASLGVLPQSGEGEIEVPPEMRSRIAAGITLAVSLEPYGGSPTGQPTGPVLALGQTRAP